MKPNLIFKYDKLEEKLKKTKKEISSLEKKINTVKNKGNIINRQVVFYSFISAFFSILGLVAFLDYLVPRGFKTNDIVVFYSIMTIFVFACIGVLMSEYREELKMNDDLSIFIVFFNGVTLINFIALPIFLIVFLFETIRRFIKGTLFKKDKELPELIIKCEALKETEKNLTEEVSSIMKEIKDSKESLLYLSNSKRYVWLRNTIKAELIKDYQQNDIISYHIMNKEKEFMENT